MNDRRNMSKLRQAVIRAAMRATVTVNMFRELEMLHDGLPDAQCQFSGTGECDELNDLLARRATGAAALDIAQARIWAGKYGGEST